MKITDEMRAEADKVVAERMSAWRMQTNRNAYVDSMARQVAYETARRLAPLIAAQALRSVDADRIAHAIGDPGSITPRRIPLPGLDGDRGETVTRWATRAVLAVLADEPDRCCARPNMVWEHSRAGKDHFRCHACGGGMTKARTVAP